MRVFPQCIASDYYSQLRFSTNIREHFGVKLDDTAIKRVYTSKGDTQGKPNNKRHRISRLKIQHQVELCLRVLKHHQRNKSTKVFTNIKYSTTVQKHCILTS